MKQKILVLEDSTTIATQLEYYLLSYGFTPILAKNGAEGIEAYWKNKDISLIITDIYMPIIDGLDALRRIKKLGYSGFSVIISQSGENALIQEAKQLGAAGWIIKPIPEDLFRKCLSKIFQRELTLQLDYTPNDDDE